MSNADKGKIRWGEHAVVCIGLGLEAIAIPIVGVAIYLGRLYDASTAQNVVRGVTTAEVMPIIAGCVLALWAWAISIRFVARTGKSRLVLTSAAGILTVLTAHGVVGATLIWIGVADAYLLDVLLGGLVIGFGSIVWDVSRRIHRNRPHR